jgi:hypothetical protein
VLIGPPPIRRCTRCPKEFQPRHRTQKICSRECRRNDALERSRLHYLANREEKLAYGKARSRADRILFKVLKEELSLNLGDIK